MKRRLLGGLAGVAFAAASFGTASAIYIEPPAGAAEVGGVIHPSETDGYINDVLTDAARRLRQIARPGSLICVISDHYHLTEDIRTHLGKSCAHGDLIGVWIHDPLEAQAPPPGRYPITDGTSRGMLDSAITGLRDAHRDDRRVRFCGAFPRAQLGAVLAGLDALVVPSQWYENTPFVVLEAMAAGVPVLASDLGGIAEVVEHEHNGELFPRGDAAALARAMVRLTQQPDRLARYRAALPQVTTLHDNATRFEAFYTEAVTNAEAKARAHP